MLLFCSSLTAQDEGRLTIVGDSLRGSVLNGESIREIFGNVVMTQGDVKVTCRKAIQYIARNEAELIGNVVATQDTIIINTSKAYYFGDEKYTYSDDTVYLNDGHINLQARTGYYYFDDKRAEFLNDVLLRDSLNTLSSYKLVYFNDPDKAVAVGKVKIVDSSSTISADSLIFMREEDISFAYSDIRISYPRNNIIITGGYLMDRGKEKYTTITLNPVLTQIDTSESGTIDTLVVLADMMEAYQDSTKRLIATDSVKIIRGNFYSLSNISVFYRAEDKIFTYKTENDTDQPVMWYDNSQLTGDSICVKMHENKIDIIDIKGDSFILTFDDNFDDRYNQISGEETKMFFTENSLVKTEVLGNVLSYYFLFEENEPNGLLKSSSEKAVLLFQDNAIADVKLYGSIKSEFHPENLIKDRTGEFTLPSFKINYNKPNKNKIISEIPNWNN
ncbi:MAG: LPS export ABC transporter periplasmic protein LptC [Melioribacteraceae bacterium]|nr:LPS export ABC transporter periplasmic protein LptC [Melioribacteraceae bacterium]